MNFNFWHISLGVGGHFWRVTRYPSSENVMIKRKISLNIILENLKRHSMHFLDKMMNFPSISIYFCQQTAFKY